MPTDDQHHQSPTVADQLRGVPDLPLIIEQLQDQLDDLQAIVRAQQTQLDRQAARLDTLEHR